MIIQAWAQAVQAGIDDPFQIPARLYAVLLIACLFAGVVTYALRHREKIAAGEINYMDFGIELAAAIFVGFGVLLGAGAAGYSHIVMLLAGAAGAFFNGVVIKIVTDFVPDLVKNRLDKAASIIQAAKNGSKDN